MAPRGGSMLVLGASGFLGVHVARSAHACGERVVMASCAAESARHAGFFGPERSVFDLADPEATARALDALAPVRIVNCAALSRIADCERDHALANALNAAAPAQLARWCTEHGARLVHVSTDLVFGGAPPRVSGYREDDPLDPRSAYGRSKAAGETALITADPSALVVRLPLLFGDSFGRALGASDALLAAVARSERPALFTDEWRTPLDVAEAARALVDLALADVRGRLHVAGAQRLTRFDLGLVVLRRAGFADVESLVRATTRAAEGMRDRPADVSLDAALWRSLRPALGGSASTRDAQPLA